MYLSREDIVKVLSEMKSFESDLNNAFAKRGYDFRSNTGRRNALMSVAQEVETAKVLREKFKKVIEDGAPGKPDIFIVDIDKELECKLTSGSKTKGIKNTFSLQTDWETLCQKESLDYVYILADKSFTEFCVLFFEGLTPDDFFPPATGSRGKSRMNKTNAMKKVKCLVGDVSCQNDKYIAEISQEIKMEMKTHILKLRSLNDRLDSVTDTQRKNVNEMLDREAKLYWKRIDKLAKRLDYWRNSPGRFSFKFDKV